MIKKIETRAKKCKDNKSSSLLYTKRAKITSDDARKINKKAKKKMIVAKRITKKRIIVKIRRSRRFIKDIITKTF